MDLKNILKAIKLNEGMISMILGAIVVLVVGVLVVNYFRGLRTVPRSAQTTSTAVSLPAEHQVVAGENLWTISENYYGSGYNWVDIAKENNLVNADIVLVGQKLSIPKVEPRVITAPVPTVVSNAISGNSYTVAKGDHLWGIAVRAYGDGYQWVKITQANELANPNLIHAGNVLVLPR